MGMSEAGEFETALRAYTREAMRAPMLSADAECAFARRWRDQDDPAALHALTSAYLRLVVAIAARFRRFGLPVSDLIQEGSVGLMQAAARFDPERGVRFSTYAAWWIRAAIQDFILRNWSIVRTGTTSAQKALFFNLRRLRAQIGDVSDVMPREAHVSVARSLGVAESDVAYMAGRLAGGDKSLSAPMGEEGDATLQDFLVDEAEGPDRQAEARHDDIVRRQVVADALSTLTAREAEIIRARQMADEPETLESIGVRFGISKERVRQIEAAALAKLRKALLRHAPDPRAIGLID